MFSAKRLKFFTPPPAGAGGNISYNNLIDAMADLASYSTTATPQTGGTLTLAGTSIGAYDYMIADATTVASFSNSSWFTATDDRIALIAIKGNFTLNSSIVFQPTQRKLLTVFYVAGNAVINGTVSMTLRGGKTYPNAQPTVRLASTWASLKVGDSSTVYTENGTEVEIAGTGAAGGAGVTIASGVNGGANGNNGASATVPNFFDPVPTPAYDPRVTIQTGGGGSGGITTESTTATSTGTSGDGAAGGSFTGGSGGGGAAFFGNNWNGGWDAQPYGGEAGSYSGTGNPSGIGSTALPGTGGVIVFIATGTITGSGAFKADGGESADSLDGSGGASGGGAVVLFSSGHSSVTATAVGGIAYAPSVMPNYRRGGNGGNGAVYRFSW